MKIKVLLFLLVHAFFVLSCTDPKEEKSAVQNKKDATRPVQSTVFTDGTAKQQTFAINNSKDTLIEGTKGTLIFIAQDAFINAVAGKPVEIELQEYYSKDEFIAASLTTTADGKLLESGGMLHIRALQNGTELKLKKDKPLQVYFPKKKERKNMEMFSGTRNASGIMNWKKQKQPAVKSDYPQPVATAEKRKRGAYMMQIEPYSGGVSVRIAQHEDDSTFFLRGKKQRLQEYMYSTISAEPALVTDFLKLNGLYRVNFDITKAGQIVNISIGLYIFDADHNFSQTSDTLILKKAKPVTDRFLNYVTKAPKVYAGITISDTQFETQEDFNSYFQKKYEKSSRKKLKQINKNEVNYYVLRSNSMGWLNCDAFFQLEKDKKTDLVVESADSTAEVFFIFEDLNSVIRESKRDGNHLSFSSIPLNKKVKVFSITTIDGKDKICLQRFTTSKDLTNIKLEYVDFNLQKINTFLK